MSFSPGSPRRILDESPLKGDEVVSGVSIEYVRAPDLEDIVAEGGRKLPRGVAIEELRATFGGNIGTLRDPLGNRQRVELDPGVPDGEGIRVKITYQVERPGGKCNIVQHRG